MDCLLQPGAKAPRAFVPPRSKETGFPKLPRLPDDDLNAKLHSLKDAENVLGAELGDLFSRTEAIGGGVRRSAAPYSPYDELGCWMY
jgi:hypothetical protein